MAERSSGKNAPPYGMPSCVCASVCVCACNEVYARQRNNILWDVGDLLRLQADASAAKRCEAGTQSVFAVPCYSRGGFLYGRLYI